MARAKSEAKRTAILEAAVQIIAAEGLEASTAKIAKIAGVAEGSLFTYFATKDVLFNELYVELKREAFAVINTGFPREASLEKRARLVWENYLHWAMESPMRRKVSMKLGLSDRVTPETKAIAMQGRAEIERMLDDLSKRSGARELAPGFISALMQSMQEATMEFGAKFPKERKTYIEKGFLAFWKAVS